MSEIDQLVTKVALRTGDTVFHRPTKETWLVAYVDETRGELAPCGWPFCLANVADCDLKRKATDEESEELLQDLAAIQEESDFRKRWALRTLTERAKTERPTAETTTG